jgi:hypothetical protein
MGYVSHPENSPARRMRTTRSDTTTGAAIVVRMTSEGCLPPIVQRTSTCSAGFSARVTAKASSTDSEMRPLNARLPPDSWSQYVFEKPGKVLEADAEAISHRNIPTELEDLRSRRVGRQKTLPRCVVCRGCPLMSARLPPGAEARIVDVDSSTTELIGNNGERRRASRA